MISQNEIFLKYLPQRDVVFVLGAGASHPDGVPLQRHLLPMILSGDYPEIINSEIGNKVIEFINDNFTYDPKNHFFPQFEAVFGFLDYFILENESLSAKYTHSEMVTIKEYLIKLIHYVVDISTNKKSVAYGKFWDVVTKYNKNISIITLNYDTLLEQAFDPLFKKVGYIDYCTHLMNYVHRPELENYNFWINPREPVVVNPKDNPAAFKIIKVHGSLNWKYCNCCNQLLLTPWDRKIDLNKGKLLGYTYPDLKEYEYTCPLDGTDFETLIMPPSFVKSLRVPVISQLFSEASREIRSTRKVIFVGYSLSNADVHIKALFKKHLDDNVEVIVINTRREESLKARYKPLSSNIKFLRRSFQELVEDEKLMKELLST
ncbi:MAG: SIR2 family protein [Melioribacteraceae bacterium]|nr:SIR2 family protein [Melioribacteraceae bacterium]